MTPAPELPQMPPWPEYEPATGDLLIGSRYIFGSHVQLAPVYERARADAAMARLQLAIGLLKDCGQHFEDLADNNVHVWPNHPLNPSKRILSALKAIGELPEGA